MAGQYYATGDRIDYSPQAGNVSSGDVIVLGGKIFLATSDIARYALGSLQAKGIFTLLKAAPLIISVGDQIYWHATGVSKTSGSALANLGLALFAGGLNDTTINVRVT